METDAGGREGTQQEYREQWKSYFSIGGASLFTQHGLSVQFREGCSDVEQR